jgi:hypothetical protein
MLWGYGIGWISRSSIVTNHGNTFGCSQSLIVRGGLRTKYYRAGTG